MLLWDLIERDPSITVLHAAPAALNRHLASVRMIDDYTGVAAAVPGALVVLAPHLSADAASYRFDLTLGELPDGVAGLALSGAAGEPSATALRTAENRGIALIALDPAADVASLAVRVRDASLGGTRETVTRLETICAIVDAYESRDEHVDSLLARLATELECDISLQADPGDCPAIALDAGTGQRVFLVVDTPTSDIVVRTALAYAGRAIEMILRRDFEAANFPVQSRGDLLNEFLLSDAYTGADALSRLRRSGFPVDGHHLAARVDLHNVATGVNDVTDRYRRQLQAARLLSEGASQGDPSWTTAGTNTSVLLVMSQSRRNDRHSAILQDRLQSGLAQLGALDPDPEWTAGVGTVQSGGGGLRNTVDEATSALRAAQANRAYNRLHHFDRLGFARALIRWYEIDDVKTTIDEILAPLARLGDKSATEAINTLRAYLDSGQSIKQTAQQLCVHRNTVRYRIKRILDVLDIDLSDPEQRLLVELGTRAMRIS